MLTEAVMPFFDIIPDPPTPKATPRRALLMLVIAAAAAAAGIYYLNSGPPAF